jgi:hypothetical protein
MQWHVSAASTKAYWIILLQLCISQQSVLAADFSDANLSGARLTNADLRGSNLSGANLSGANLSNTDLRDTNVTQQQLDRACGSETKLPAGLRIEPCPAPTASKVDANVTDHRASVVQTLPKAYDDDRGFSYGILVGVPPMQKNTQASSQRPEHAGVPSGFGN